MAAGIGISFTAPHQMITALWTMDASVCRLEIRPQAIRSSYKIQFKQSINRSVSRSSLRDSTEREREREETEKHKRWSKYTSQMLQWSDSAGLLPTLCAIQIYFVTYIKYLIRPTYVLTINWQLKIKSISCPDKTNLGVSFKGRVLNENTQFTYVSLYISPTSFGKKWNRCRQSMQLLVSIRQVAAATCDCMFLLRGSTPKYLLPWESGTPSNTMCHWTPQVYLPNGI